MELEFATSAPTESDQSLYIVIIMEQILRFYLKTQEVTSSSGASRITKRNVNESSMTAMYTLDLVWHVKICEV